MASPPPPGSTPRNGPTLPARASAAASKAANVVSKVTAAVKSRNAAPTPKLISNAPRYVAQKVGIINRVKR